VKDRIRVALVQSESKVGQEDYDPRGANLEKALSDVRRAAGDEADLVVFGEMYLSGYRTDEHLHKYATMINPPDKHLQALFDAARENNVYVIMGAATYGSAFPGDIYNSALLIGPREGLIGVYRKTHVSAFPYSRGVSTERCFYSPGKEIPVFETRIGRIGIHICYDIWFPEVSRVQVLKGADYLINVSASAAGFEVYWDHVLITRAVENAVWYAVCSVVGIQRGDHLFGGSRVVDPNGQVMVTGKYDEEDLVICDIDPAKTRSARGRLHIFSVRQPELYTSIAEPAAYP